MVEPCRTVETDVLVIGGGGAGARAVIEAAKNNVRVTFVSKGPIGKTGLTAASGGSYVVLESPPGEPFEELFREAVLKGCYLNDQNLLEIWWKESRPTVEEFKSSGAKVTENRGGGSYRITGSEMMSAFKTDITRHPNIRLVQDSIVTKLLTHNGVISGAASLDLASSEFSLIKAKAVIIATGGLGGLYWPAEATPLGIDPGVTGAGHVLAYRAGAELVNMEMIMFSWIPLNPKRVFACRHFENLAAAGSKGPYCDKDGKTVISSEEIETAPCGMGSPDHYNPYLMRRLAEEMKKGPCYLKNVAVKPGQRRSHPDVDEVLKLDMSELQMVQVIPGCLTSLGGPRVNEKCATSTPGLFAAGEVIGNINGAFRTYMLSQIIVFGKRAGLCAAEYAKKADQIPTDVDKVMEERERVYGFLKLKPDGISPVEVKKKIRDLSMKRLYVLRNRDGLMKAIKEIEQIKKADLPRLQAADIRKFNLEWLDCIEVPVMLDAAEMIARSALFRAESRGCHYREDFPEMDNENWLCHTLLKEEAGGMTLSKAPVLFTTMPPPVVENA
ncbi:MAG: FAD-binding protein [Deltaproteobacteria bacterium]|nr:FAD-binding protein [Deltaproteobacteria bacterium]